MIKALTNGDLVIIDNIQLDSPQIIEIISRLCGKNHVLDLIERGEGFYF